MATMMRCLPDRATSPMVTQLHGRLCTGLVNSQARDSFGEAVIRGGGLAAISTEKTVYTIQNAQPT